MFVVIPLIVSLNVHTTVPYSVGKTPFSSEVTYVAHLSWAVGNQQIVGELPNMSEIVQLAKNAAASLRSPPRIYATSGSSVNLWPDQPGTAVEISYGTSGVQPPPGGEASFSYGASMTLRTLVESVDAENYSVIFQSTWTEAGALRSHAWKFRVSADHQAIFIDENGDALPPLRM